MLNTLTDAAAAYLNVLARQVGRGSAPAQRREHAQESRDLARARRGRARRALRLPALGGAAGARQADAAGRGSRAAGRRKPKCCASCTALRTSRSAPWKSGIDDPLALVSSPRTQAFLDTPAKWAVFMEYAVHTALENAPEIKQADVGAHGAAACAELGRARLLSTRPGAGVERLEVHGQERRGFAERSGRA